MDAKSFMAKLGNKDVFLLTRHNEMPCPALDEKGLSSLLPYANSLTIEGGTHNESRRFIDLAQSIKYDSKLIHNQWN